MEVFTVGFAKHSAREFFGKLRNAGVRRLIDVRLNNVSQLAGFTKKDDLEFFMREVCDADYVHLPVLAPTQEMLNAYRKSGESWSSYERQFLSLMADRRIEQRVEQSLFDVPSVLLCSEPTAAQCHRRLVLEYLQRYWSGLKVKHL